MRPRFRIQTTISAFNYMKLEYMSNEISSSCGWYTISTQKFDRSENGSFKEMRPPAEMKSRSRGICYARAALAIRPHANGDWQREKRGPRNRWKIVVCLRMSDERKTEDGTTTVSENNTTLIRGSRRYIENHEFFSAQVIRWKYVLRNQTRWPKCTHANNPSEKTEALLEKASWNKRLATSWRVVDSKILPPHYTTVFLNNKQDAE